MTLGTTDDAEEACRIIDRLMVPSALDVAIEAFTSTLQPYDPEVALTEFEGKMTLAEIDVMSRENATDSNGPWLHVLDRLAPLTHDVGPDFDARRELLQHMLAIGGVPCRPLPQNSRSRRLYLPVYVGDRPADLTDREIAEAANTSREYQRDELARAISARPWCINIPARRHAWNVRRTHRTIHRALAGETTGATIAGCQWCAEGER